MTSWPRPAISGAARSVRTIAAAASPIVCARKRVTPGMGRDICGRARWPGGGTKGRQLSVEEVDKVRAELANYHRFAQVSEQIVAVNEAICEARPPNPAATAPPAGTTGHKKGGSATRSRRSSPPR